MPTPNGSDEFIGISRPGDRLWFQRRPVDGLLKIHHRTEDAALEPLARQLGEEAFKATSRMAVVAVESGADLRVLVSRIVHQYI